MPRAYLPHPPEFLHPPHPVSIRFSHPTSDSASHTPGPSSRQTAHRLHRPAYASLRRSRAHAGPSRLLGVAPSYGVARKLHALIRNPAYPTLDPFTASPGHSLIVRMTHIAACAFPHRQQMTKSCEIGPTALAICGIADPQCLTRRNIGEIP